MNRLAACLSPLPPDNEQRRDSSGEDYFFNLPVPRQFADNSRRSSGVPERILEMEETSVSLEKEHLTGNTLLVPEIKDIERCSSEQRPPFLLKYDDMRPPIVQIEKPLPEVAIESNVYVGDTINIIDTDQPVIAQV